MLDFRSHFARRPIHQQRLAYPRHAQLLALMGPCLLILLQLGLCQDFPIQFQRNVQNSDLERFQWAEAAGAHWDLERFFQWAEVMEAHQRWDPERFQWAEAAGARLERFFQWAEVMEAHQRCHWTQASLLVKA